MIAIDLSKQQTPDADPRAIQQINFTRNWECVGKTLMFFILEEIQESILGFSQRNVRLF